MSPMNKKWTLHHMHSQALVDFLHHHRFKNVKHTLNCGKK